MVNRLHYYLPDLACWLDKRSHIRGDLYRVQHSLELGAGFSVGHIYHSCASLLDFNGIDNAGRWRGTKGWMDKKHELECEAENPIIALKQVREGAQVKSTSCIFHHSHDTVRHASLYDNIETTETFP